MPVLPSLIYGKEGLWHQKQSALAELERVPAPDDDQVNSEQTQRLTVGAGDHLPAADCM
jgi:hypothetical protein